MGDVLIRIGDYLAVVLMLLGALLSLAAAIGLLRFPDTLARLHTAAKPQVLGLLLILLGVALRLRSLSDVATLTLVVAFQLATAPVAAHLLGRAAVRRSDAASAADPEPDGAINQPDDRPTGNPRDPGE